MFTSLTDGVNIDTKQLHRHKDTKLHEIIVAWKQASLWDQLHLELYKTCKQENSMAENMDFETGRD
jgi:hypothetical protein